jgi:hypothetical protein
MHMSILTTLKSKIAKPAESEEIIQGTDDNPQKKGKPTPKRDVAAKKNYRPIANKDRKAAYKQARELERIRRERNLKSGRSGNDADMLPRDKGPVKRYIRDYIDARLSICEFFLPVAIAALVTSFVTMGKSMVIYNMVIVVVWTYITVILIDTVILNIKLRKKLLAKFSEEEVKKSGFLLFYILTRSTQLRKMRLPKPTSEKRGNFPK